MLRACDALTLPVAAFALAAGGCARPLDASGSAPLVVEAWWVPSTEGLTWAEARAGLWWALSNLGAAPPADEAGLSHVVESEDGVMFTLDFGAVGLPEASLPAVEAALAPVRAWSVDEGPVDVGRILLATLYEPGRYYAITGACPTVEAWRGARQVADPPLYAVTLSLLVDGDRLVALNPAPAPTAAPDLSVLGWLAAEGEGSLADGSFVEEEFETADVMANGQARYAVYTQEGELRAAGAASPAGQPGKCMWCHEAGIQPGTPDNPSAEGYLDYDAFVAEVDAAEALLSVVRDAQPTALDWRYPTHEWAEHLTATFLEPAPARVAREWGVGIEEVYAEGLATHTNGEFPEWGELYTRADVDAARARRQPGWEPLALPPSDRELDPAWPLFGAEDLACSPSEATDAG